MCFQRARGQTAKGQRAERQRAERQGAEGRGQKSLVEGNPFYRETHYKGNILKTRFADDVATMGNPLYGESLMRGQGAGARWRTSIAYLVIYIYLGFIHLYNVHNIISLSLYIYIYLYMYINVYLYVFIFICILSAWLRGPPEPAAHAGFGRPAGRRADWLSPRPGLDEPY